MTSLALLSANRRVTATLVALTGLTFAILAWQYARRQESEGIHAAFLRRAQTQVTVANQRLHNFVDMVYSLRGAFLGQQTVTREEFGRVARDLLQRHSGVQALEWVPIIPAADRPAYEQQAGAELGRPFVIRHRTADGSLKAAPDRAEYWAVYYIEPLADNEAALGYDLLSAPTVPFLSAARQTGQLTVSHAFRLTQSASPQDEPGVVFILPFSRPGAPAGVVEGFLQGVFRVQTMLAQSHQLNTNDALDTYYLDTDPATGRPVLLYANLAGEEPLRTPGATVVLPPLDDPADFHTTISLGDRQWRMLIRVNQAWAADRTTHQPELILAAGITIAVLIALFINSLLQRTEFIEREVTERTLELAENRRELDSILQALPGAAFRCRFDEQLTALFASEGMLALTGYAAEDFIAGRVHIAQLTVPADRPVVRAAGENAIREKRPFELEYRLIHRDGQERWLLVRGQPIFAADGSLRFLEGLAIDVSALKRAEQEKIAIERKLLEAQKLESLGVLAGGIAHDFNNILTAILGNASLAAMNLPRSHSVHRQLHQIENAARRAGDLCSQMLAYAGKASFVTAPVNLSALVRDTTALLEVSVGKRAHLELRTLDGLPAVLGDITQLRQIVMNLVINAADAIGERPDGLISVTTFSRTLPADFFRTAVQSPELPAGLYVGLEVRDNGSGMAPEVVARIFEPFFTTKFSGRGLGLAAVLGIVQSHDGALQVESQPDRGTVFRLFLPATLSPAEPSPPTRPHPPTAKLKGTVLVVDDEPAVRQVAGQALSALGLQHFEAADGTTAVQLLCEKTGLIDLVLLDLTMPGLSGEDTLRQLRTLAPELRVIVMSGYSEGETMQRCARLGAMGFLPKPFELSGLMDKLRPHLG